MFLQHLFLLATKSRSETVPVDQPIEKAPMLQKRASTVEVKGENVCRAFLKLECSPVSQKLFLSLWRETLRSVGGTVWKTISYFRKGSLRSTYQMFELSLFLLLSFYNVEIKTDMFW